MREPTIIATSAGFTFSDRSTLITQAVFDFALAATGVARPKVCHLGTAGGDNGWWTSMFYGAMDPSRVEASHLDLFPMPNIDDVAGHLLGQDLIWVGGGSVANLLACWRVHGLDEIFAEAWAAGVVLAGVSAGSVCWHVGGTTDSFGPDLRAVTNGLALLPYGNGVHYDSEARRRPLLQSLVADGTLPLSYATDDGVALHYVGTELVEVVTEQEGAYGYRVEAVEGTAVETVLPTRVLSGARPPRN
jgi:peptidase E